MLRFPPTIVLLILSGLFMQTQAQTYQLTVSNEPFVFLENAEVGFEGAWDVPEFQLPIGFDFELFDFTSDTLYSYFNSFGGTFEVNLDEDHLYMLLPFFASLIDRGAQQDSALSPISYKTEGIPGQQVFTLEYKEAGLFEGLETDDGVFLDHISFQVRLYEESGDIEFHYGPYITQEDPEVIFDPYIGPLVGLLADADWNTFGGLAGEIMLLAGNPLKPTIITENIDTSLTGPIPENTVYRFTRMETAVSDHLTSTTQSMFFPNPTLGEINLEDSYSNTVNFPISVFDALGKQVMVWRSESGITAEGLTAGYYYAVINSNGNIYTEKIIVLNE